MRKPDLRSLELDLTGWEQLEKGDTEIKWQDAMGAILSLHFFPQQPVLGGSLQELDKLRWATRAQVDQAQGGLIEFDILSIQELPALRQIVKFHSEQGNAYLGSIIMPFSEFSFVINVQNIERGMTGAREAVVTDALLAADESDSADPPADWFADPYEPSFRASHPPSLRSKADDEIYDELIPDHPLSQVRRGLAHIVQTTACGVELYQAAKF